jgi:hypothetical protein
LEVVEGGLTLIGDEVAEGSHLRGRRFRLVTIQPCAERVSLRTPRSARPS